VGSLGRLKAAYIDKRTLDRDELRRAENELARMCWGDVAMLDDSERHNVLHTHRVCDQPQVDLGAKGRISGDFGEPSDGLEPSTPSLPWREGVALPALFFVDLCVFSVASTDSLTGLSCPKEPRTCPQDVSPTCCLARQRAASAVNARLECSGAIWWLGRSGR